MAIASETNVLRTHTHPSGEHSSQQLDNLTKILMRSSINGLKTELAATTELEDPAYLAWEVVRGGRAGEIVGEVKGPDGRKMPYTGFEGYFAGKTPEEIVAKEVELGQTILSSIHNYASLGTRSEITESELKSALRGGKFPAGYSREILTFYDTLFRITLARVRGITLPEDYAEFQRATYQRVAKRQFAHSPEHVNISVVTLKDQKAVDAYSALAEIGLFGHPELKATYKIITEPRKPDQSFV